MARHIQSITAILYKLNRLAIAVDSVTNSGVDYTKEEKIAVRLSMRLFNLVNLVDKALVAGLTDSIIAIRGMTKIDETIEYLNSNDKVLETPKLIYWALDVTMALTSLRILLEKNLEKSN